MRLGAGRGPHFMRHRGVGACADPDIADGFRHRVVS